MAYGVIGEMRKVLAGIVFSVCGFSASAEQVTIAALGDSLTQGYGLVQQDGFVPQLQGWLADNGADVVLINAGVSGDTTAGGAARVAWTLTPEVDGVIVALGGNDLLRGIDPDVSRSNLAKILAAALEANVEVLLVGMQAPGNYGPEYKETFDAIYPELAEQYDALYEESFFAGIAGETPDPSEMRGYMQEDGIHPNPDGVQRIVEVIGPRVLDLINRIEMAD
ncbi:arylesterase [Sedimentitalea todarodis]|uniref:Arylesterase n=1 Tax=Sedimentitalea todarodis TaxID=1631240 RepID=A0ABU3VFM8_9RHOB|nr:arylesterase [Sedimentitalea todarodis]MDU9004974.1 arylesterase [Sedimentitalea todarodis]